MAVAGVWWRRNMWLSKRDVVVAAGRLSVAWRTQRNGVMA